MESVLISPKFQVVIPRSIRALLHLVPGQKIQVIPYEDRLEMIPEKRVSEMRGFLKGIDVTLEREGDRL